MADVPFFRGQNRLDWLYAVILQTACDWGSIDQISSVAAVFGDNTVTRYQDPFGVYPSVTVILVPGFVFVVSNSTKGTTEWVGNVLGSPAGPVHPSHGSVSVWFGLCALDQYQGVKAQVIAAAASRRVVLIGFSLGAASVTIMKDMLHRNDAIESACIVFGVPRAGTTSFDLGYPGNNYSGFGTPQDPVLSVPPVIWCGLSNNNAWGANFPFVTYTKQGPGYTLQLDNTISDGYTTFGVTDTAQKFADGTIAAHHYQPLYATLLRGGDLPDKIPDGFDGFPFGSKIDPAATDVFSWDGVPWAWPKNKTLLKGVLDMGVQLAFYIRNAASPPLGFQEIYYFLGDDPVAVFAAATDGTYPWVQKRKVFLSKSCEIYAVRVSHVGSPKASLLKRYDPPIGGVTPATDTIEDAICYLGFSGDGQSKRQFHFRGIASTWIAGDKLSPQGQGSSGVILGSPVAFLDVLQAAGLQMLVSRSAGQTGTPIVAAAQATANTPITLTLGSTLVVPTGQLIEIRGCRQAPLLNGRWRNIGSGLAGQVTLSGSQRYSAPPVIAGTLWQIGVPFRQVANFQFNSVTSKKTGRPSFLQRGRQSAQLRHR